MEKIKNTVPVNYDLFVWSYHWENKTSIIIIIIIIICHQQTQCNMPNLMQMAQGMGAVLVTSLSPKMAFTICFQILWIRDLDWACQLYHFESLCVIFT